MKLFLILCLVPFNLLAFTGTEILGKWVTKEEKSHIEIFKCGEEFCGKIVYLKEPLSDGKPKVDKHNPDDSKKQQPIIGLQIINGLKFEDDEWVSGSIYDPESGKTYKSKASMDEKDLNTLNLRGYIGIPLLGRTEKWVKLAEKSK